MWRFVVVVLGALGACGPVPKSRAEFISAVKSGASGSTHETFTVPGTLDNTEARVGERASACLDKLVTRGPVDNMSGPSSTRYIPSVERSVTGGVEFTLKVQHRPRGTREPESGLYVLAADLTATGESTAVELYAPTWGFADIADALRAWLRASSNSCPDLK